MAKATRFRIPDMPGAPLSSHSPACLQGVEQDFIASYQWLTLSMNALPDEALAARNAVVTKMTHDEVQQGQDAVQEWRRTHRAVKTFELPDLSASWGALMGSLYGEELEGRPPNR